MKKLMAMALVFGIVAAGAVYAQGNGRGMMNNNGNAWGWHDFDDMPCFNRTGNNIGTNGNGNGFGVVNAPWFGWMMPRWNTALNGVAVLNNNTASFESFSINFRMWRDFITNDPDTSATDGTLRLGSQAYTLKNSTLVNGTFSAEVYRNSTDVGSVSLSRNQNNHWYGQLNADNATYNVYIVGNQRMFWYEPWIAEED